MFYDKFAALCYERHTTPNAVCAELGLSNSIATYWKKSKGTPKRETLEKIAEYLDVSVDALLSKETKNAPDNAIKSAIIEKVNTLTNAQAAQLLAFLESFLQG